MKTKTINRVHEVNLSPKSYFFQWWFHYDTIMLVSYYYATLWSDLINVFLTIWFAGGAEYITAPQHQQSCPVHLVWTSDNHLFIHSCLFKKFDRNIHQFIIFAITD